MSVETLALPRLGETMESGRVAGWLKKPGETFRRGETIVEIESDKTVVELPALADGRLVEILAAEGAEVEVGAGLCLYEGGSGALPQAPPKVSPLETDTGAGLGPPAPAGSRGRAPGRATPLARRIARDGGVSLSEIEGTGRRGRVEARDVRGIGGAVLLLHGFGGDAQTWAGLKGALSRKGFRVVAPELNGADTVEGLVAAAIAAAESVGGDFELVGHSLGGAVAVGVARALPDRVRRLTLIAPAGLGTEIDADFVAGMASARHPGALAHLLRRLSVRPAAMSQAVLSEMAASLGSGRLAALASAIVSDGRQTLDIVGDLGALTMPVRIVWGLEDRIIPWRHVLQAPSRTALHLVANAGHMPHWDQPQEIAALFD